MQSVKANVSIDWTVRENVRAKLRVLVKRILKKHGYPPDKQEKATQTVLEQAEALRRTDPSYRSGDPTPTFSAHVPTQRTDPKAVDFDDQQRAPTSERCCIETGRKAVTREHQHYLIVDVEATCSNDHQVPRLEMEIIEFGAVMVQVSELRSVDDFGTFVRPVRHPKLTRFCTELTSIRQQDVDGQPLFPEALERLTCWASRFPDFMFCSWGNYDRNQIEQDCLHHRISNPFTAVDSMNLKTEFARVQGGRRKMGMAGALTLAGLPLLGTHHRGIDDARNMARLLPWIVGDKVVA